MSDRDDFIIGCNELKIAHFEDKMDKVDKYVSLLKKWNKHFNLIGPKTVSEIYKRHVLDSVQLVPHFNSDQKIIDFGTGAGLPSVIISIFLGCEVHAVERNGKKYQFLNTVKRELELGDKFFIHNDDIEDLPLLLNSQFDVVTARAFADVPKIIDFGDRFLKEGGQYILLKGENVAKEIISDKLKIKMTTKTKDSITLIHGKILFMSRST
jgi:16S rRNA (guanine527-N7)-methyltransferase